MRNHKSTQGTKNTHTHGHHTVSKSARDIGNHVEKQQIHLDLCDDVTGNSIPVGGGIVTLTSACGTKWATVAVLVVVVVLVTAGSVGRLNGLIASMGGDRGSALSTAIPTAPTGGDGNKLPPLVELGPTTKEPDTDGRLLCIHPPT